MITTTVCPPHLTEDEYKLSIIYEMWTNDPVLGVETLFSVDVDDQQAELIKAYFKPDSFTAVKSCQGAGKTATLVWIAYLSLLILPECRILITSPSFQQLDRVFYSEAMLWKSKMPRDFRDMFDVTRTRISIKGKEFQVANLVTASAENEENLQGGHAANYSVLADEASGIDEAVFDILIGTFGTGIGRFVMTSNPIRNSGRFYELFHKDYTDWQTLTFTAEGSSQVTDTWIQRMANMYGVDSDIYKIRVLAQFPTVSEEQFIPTHYVEQAMTNIADPAVYKHMPKLCGVDVARFGSDKTVLCCRQGPKLLDVTAYHGLDTMEVAQKVVDYYRMWVPEAIFIDAIGIGAGVFDRLKQLSLPVIEVVVSTKSTEPKMYFNLRAQLWGELRQWLQNGADIPDNPDIKSQMCSMSYGYNARMQIQLASKKDIKRTGLKSPDIPDAVSLTMAGNTFHYTPRRAQKRNIKRARYQWV